MAKTKTTARAEEGAPGPGARPAGRPGHRRRGRPRGAVHAPARPRPRRRGDVPLQPRLQQGRDPGRTRRPHRRRHRVPGGPGDWKEAMRRRAVSMRRTFARHPWALGLLESRRTVGPAAMRYFDSVLGVLRRAGFPPAMALRAFSILDSYAYGFVIQEKNLPTGSEAEAQEVTEDIAPGASRGRVPPPRGDHRRRGPEGRLQPGQGV